jgi:predicted enzyme related to lactoylglutathione lyase
VTSGLSTIVYPVRELDAAKALYAKLLGVAPYADTPYYVGFRLGGVELALDPNGHEKGMNGPVGYWEVDDIEAALAALLDAGAEAEQAVTDVGDGTLIASVRDADGNVTALRQAPPK